MATAMKKKMLLSFGLHHKSPFADIYLIGFFGIFPGIVVALYNRESLLRKEAKRQ